MTAAIVLTLERFSSGERVLLDAIASEARTCGAALIVVPFGSAPVDAVRAACEERALPVAPAGGGSFGDAANVGARLVAGDVLAFVNAGAPQPPGWFVTLAQTLLEPGVGVVGPLVRFSGGAGESCGYIVHPAPFEPHGFRLAVLAGGRARFDCDAFSSDCLITTRALFSEVGGFAETFGSEFEAIDYCLRVGERGRRVVFQPAVSVERGTPPVDLDAQRPGEVAFNERWRGRIETHENYWPELTGSIVRTEYFSDGVVTGNVAIPRLEVLAHGDPVTPAFLAQLNDLRMRPAAAVYADAASAVQKARQLTEVRGTDYVAFVRTDTHLTRETMNELINTLERTPNTAATFVGDAADARCTLVAPRRIPQHLRIEAAASLDAAVAAWLRAAAAAGRTIVPLARTGTVVGPASEVQLTIAPPPVKPFVSIVMLSWNAPEYTEMCIASVRRCTTVPHEIIVIDNGSRAETVARIAAIPDIRVVYNAVNTGFAFGSNQGLAAARGTHVVLLNNDIIVSDGWLEPLLAIQAQRGTVGCSVPRSNKVFGLQKVDVPYTDVADMQAFATQWTAEHRGQWRQSWRVIGLCMCLDRRVVDEIGGLDTLFGTGNFEDDDYCMRIRAAGYELAICDDSYVHHFGSVSFQANAIDYDATLKTNLELFSRKWNIVSDGTTYDGLFAAHVGFRRERDYVPLPPAVGVGPDWTNGRGVIRK